MTAGHNAVTIACWAPSGCSLNRQAARDRYPWLPDGTLPPSPYAGDRLVADGDRIAAGGARRPLRPEVLAVSRGSRART